MQEVQYVKGGARLPLHPRRRAGGPLGKDRIPPIHSSSTPKSGEEMTLNRGKTYFALVDNDELEQFQLPVSRIGANMEPMKRIRNCALPLFCALRRTAGRLRLSAQRQRAGNACPHRPAHRPCPRVAGPASGGRGH
ncbi:MAG: hypothetical protein ACLVJH_04375 [Faecalibacterium prausnitzii]